MGKPMPQEALEKLQGELLELLVEFDRLCRKYEIRYFLSSGTLLGAVRHEGFIPWDDDADVELLRPDYERLREAARLEYGEDSPFYFQDSTTDADYRWPYGKFRRTGTHAVRPGQAGALLRDGIFLDVFVVDVLAPRQPMQSIMYLVTAFARKILWAPVGWHILRNPVEKLVFYLLHFLPKRAGLALYHWAANWYRGKHTGWAAIFNTASTRPHGYAYEMAWYEATLEQPFSGHSFMIPVGYDGILKRKYGSYRELPPIEKRVGNADLESITFSDGTVWRQGGERE